LVQAFSNGFCFTSAILDYFGACLVNDSLFFPQRLLAVIGMVDEDVGDRAGKELLKAAKKAVRDVPFCVVSFDGSEHAAFSHRISQAWKYYHKLQHLLGSPASLDDQLALGLNASQLSTDYRRAREELSGAPPAKRIKTSMTGDMQVDGNGASGSGDQQQQQQQQQQGERQ
jgi:hypothetical protein